MNADIRLALRQLRKAPGFAFDRATLALAMPMPLLFSVSEC